MYQTVHYALMKVKAPREALLDAAMKYVAENGMADVSLRELAAALGTSHRMLIHHFGSKQGLWVEIVRTAEERQRELLDQMLPPAGASPGEAMRAWWRHISDPALWPNERLFFELYGQALQGRAHTGRMLDGIVERWVAPAAEVYRSQGMTSSQARARARLGLATIRGLLLDLLATRDRAGVDAAMEAFIELQETWLENRIHRVQGPRNR
jgi:AcrR family transcriptional regulator